jgi:hypothetical protein
MPEVQIYPHPGRPGVGLRPRRESQRPFLPQHARHCPVLEAGSSLGYMVYPPLEKHEAFQLEYLGDGRYQFVYMLSGPGARWQTLFTLVMTLPQGGVGMINEKLTFNVPEPPISREEALRVARVFFIPEDCGTPAGAVTLLGATNFKTPAGWDSVYTPVFNLIERPVAPMLVVRVETDWFPHDSEFRYVLAPGEGITGTQTMPIGQVFFVPREEVTLSDMTEAEVAELKRIKDEYLTEKSGQKLTTRYGLQYSPHYAKTSESLRKEATKSESDAKAESDS